MMSYGLWGSRVPLGNILSSRAIFVCVELRLGLKRLANRLRGRNRLRTINPSSDPSSEIEMEKWLNKGYDRLNIGGGPKNLDGFVNIDFVRYTNVVRAVTANILDLSFVPSRCVSHIHSNHVIEHLTDDQLSLQLKEYYRILRDKGTLSVRCPNALGVAYGFWFDPVLEDEKEEFISLGFPPDEDFGNQEDGWMHKDLFGLLHWFYGDIGNKQNEHLNILTPTRLTGQMEEAGFVIEKTTKPEAINIVVVARKK